MYAWLKRGLFAFSPETAHDLALAALSFGRPFGLTGLMGGYPADVPVDFLGMKFSNPVGLGAGMDKNGDYIDALGELGFGFLELGTVTPRPQPGNPKPRMFRLEAAEAVINRMGFNNKGVDHLVERLSQRRWRGIVGANIGKQADTPLDRAADDYRYCLERVHDHCDYVVVNVSSPNTPDLRRLQERGALGELLAELVRIRDHLAAGGARPRPLLVKISPDWTAEELTECLETIARAGADGLIATNTTVERPGVAGLPHADESGGLSGRPLLELSNRVLARAREVLGPDFPIIASGGITRPEHAAEKVRLGAGLVQIYTGFIFHGPALIKSSARAIGELRASQLKASA